MATIIGNIGLLSQTECSVPYGNGYIAVWRHPTFSDRFYVMPLGFLMHESARIERNLEKKYELLFDVLMWNNNARKAVWLYIREKLWADVIEDDIEVLPLENIRILSKKYIPKLSLSDMACPKYRRQGVGTLIFSVFIGIITNVLTGISALTGLLTSLFCMQCAKYTWKLKSRDTKWSYNWKQIIRLPYSLCYSLFKICINSEDTCSTCNNACIYIFSILICILTDIIQNTTAFLIVICIIIKFIAEHWQYSHTLEYDGYELMDQWRSNTHLRHYMTFGYLCKTEKIAQKLLEVMKTKPIYFGDLELEYKTMSLSNSPNPNHVLSQALMIASEAEIKQIEFDSRYNVMKACILEKGGNKNIDESDIQKIIANELKKNEISKGMINAHIRDSY